jgi:DNA-directed RNA polymerases I and III subunit RPAC2
MLMKVGLVDDYTAYEALTKGFDDLMDLCDVITQTFEEARDAFEEEKAS